MPNCNECKFKRAIAGNAHISCANPCFDNLKADPMVGILSIMGAPIATGLEKALDLTASDYGVQSGWCFFPFNYDPVWLSGECSGFQKMGDHEDSNG